MTSPFTWPAITPSESFGHLVNSSWPAPAQLTGLIYPWRIEPPLAVHRHAKVAFVLYSDGMHPAHAARRSMARRRVGNERLLHEDIDGDIYITLTHPLQLIRIPPP